MRSSAPPFLYPCYYGTDVDSQKNLVAWNRTVEEVRRIIGVDSLGYLSCENAHKLAENTTGFCTACFDGKYPTNPPKKPDKTRFERGIDE